MEAQYFVYTRGFDIANDYKLMFSPSNDFCPDDIRKYFLQQVRGVINIEQYQGSLESPRWLFSRYNGFLLWGMGIMNSELCETSNSDYTGRAVRGFFGMVFRDDALTKLPYDLGFWKNFYAQHVVHLWNVSKEEFKQKGVSVEESFELYQCITPNYDRTNLLNLELNKTVIWGGLSEMDMFSTAMTLKDNVSCVSGIKEREHAYNHEYNYLNVIVEDIKETESKDYSEKKDVTPKEPITDIQVEKYNRGKKTKKVVCPKLMLMIVCIMIVLLLLILITKKIWKSEKFPSGNVEIKQTEKVYQNSRLDSIIE